MWQACGQNFKITSSCYYCYNYFFIIAHITHFISSKVYFEHTTRAKLFSGHSIETCSLNKVWYGWRVIQENLKHGVLFVLFYLSATRWICVKTHGLFSTNHQFQFRRRVMKFPPFSLLHGVNFLAIFPGSMWNRKRGKICLSKIAISLISQSEVAVNCTKGKRAKLPERAVFNRV